MKQRGTQGLFCIQSWMMSDLHPILQVCTLLSTHLTPEIWFDPLGSCPGPELPGGCSSHTDSSGDAGMPHQSLGKVSGLEELKPQQQKINKQFPQGIRGICFDIGRKNKRDTFSPFSLLLISNYSSLLVKPVHKHSLLRGNIAPGS